MKEYEQYRSDIIEKINKAKDEIITLKNYIESNKDDLSEIKNIINKLKQVEKSLKPRQQWFKERVDSLDLITEELLKLRQDITLTMIEQLFEIIASNLPDGMDLENASDNENLTNIVFDGIKVGDIGVIEDNNHEVRLKVTVYENSAIFEVNEPRRVYSIISYINTKFNYKET